MTIIIIKLSSYYHHQQQQQLPLESYYSKVNKIKYYIRVNKGFATNKNGETSYLLFKSEDYANVEIFKSLVVVVAHTYMSVVAK